MEIVIIVIWLILITIGLVWLGVNQSIIESDSEKIKETYDEELRKLRDDLAQSKQNLYQMNTQMRILCEIMNRMLEEKEDK